MESQLGLWCNGWHSAKKALEHARHWSMGKGGLTHHVRHKEQSGRPDDGSDHPNFVP